MMYGRLVLALLALVATVQLGSQITRHYGFMLAVRPLLRAAVNIQAPVSDPCAAWTMETGSRLTAGQRLVVGSALRSVGCPDQAAHILPKLTANWDRSALLSYQWGLIAWQNEDVTGAAEIWRQGQDIDRRLLFQARETPADNLQEAQRLYESAIMAASSPQGRAEAITAYTEDLRGRLPAKTFQARLASLIAYFGADTAIGHRLGGQNDLWTGNYRAAVKQLSQAITLGVTDAETWYLLGDAAWQIGDLTTAERALRSALNAPIQISWRRPWHLDRLATLLRHEGRPSEALPFQEEAVRLNDYYRYANDLAVLYSNLGRVAEAQTMCAKARNLAGNAFPQVLPCEQP